MFTPIEQTTLAYQDEHNLTEYDFGEVNGTSQPQLHDTFQMVHVIVRLLEGLLAILGNGATVLAIMKFEYLRTTTNFIICSLAVADILGGLNPLLLLLHSQLTTNFNVWVRLCLVEQSLSLMSSGMNVITIMLISFDRCIYIQYPLRYYSLVKSSQVIVMLVASWVFLIIQVVVLFQTGLKVWPGMTCRAHAFFDGLTYTILVNGQFLFYTIIIIVLYSRIACIAYKQAIAVGNEQVGIAFIISISIVCCLLLLFCNILESKLSMSQLKKL